MKFDIITIFPNIFTNYFKESIIQKAIGKDLISIGVHDLRDYTKDSHKTVDERPFGGGRGMVMKVGPIFRAVSDLKQNKNKKTKNSSQKVILFTPRGKKFNQKKAYQLSKKEHLVLICGRYEGVDERVAKYIADETISIGDYVLMGGELPAMVLIETVSRLIPGVIGKSELLEKRMPKENKGRGFREFPQYTRPKVFKSQKGEEWKVPEVLLSGHHEKITKWRKKHSKIIE